MRVVKWRQRATVWSNAKAFGALLFAFSIFFHIAFAPGYFAFGDHGWLCAQPQGHFSVSSEEVPVKDAQLGQVHCDFCTTAQTPPLVTPQAVEGLRSAAVSLRGPRLSWVNPPDVERPRQALARAPPHFS